MGEEEEEFHVHENLICKHSVLFNSAIKKEWKEGQERRVVLPDDTPSVVNLYAQWLYSDKIISRQSPNEEDERTVAEYSLLIDAFVFGEKIQDGPFKDASIDALIHLVDTPDKDGWKWYPTGRVDFAYQGTPEGSPLRKLLVDMHMFHGNGEWLSSQKNADYMRELGKRLLNDRPNL